MTVITKKEKTPQRRVSRKSIHGHTPFVRWAFASLVTIVISMIVGIGAVNMGLLEARERFAGTQDVLGWIFASMLIPYAVLYIMVFAISIFLLSQSTVKYAWWVIKQSMSASLTYMFATLVIATMVLGVAFAVSQPGVTSTNQTTEFAASQMWIAGHIAVTFVAWGAYRSAWMIYRSVGAQTMQQRYEADVAKMEVSTSGRFWDKWVERPIKWMFGLDGRKPRGFALYFPFTLGATIVATSSVFVYGTQLMMPLALLAVPSIIVTFFAAVAKYRDGRYNKKTAPVLDKVRDKTTEDTYNPASKGHKVFVR